jgi:hypothetical protein
MLIGETCFRAPNFARGANELGNVDVEKKWRSLGLW